MIAVFLAYCLLQAPHTLLIRPHPAIWRLVHGMAVIYIVTLTFLLFQKRDDAQQFMRFLHPDLGVAELSERSYGADCRIYVPENPTSRGITNFSIKYRTDVKKFDKNNPGIRRIKSQCPREPQNYKDCGYYVCRFMFETIQKRRQVIPDKYFGGANTSFPQVKIDKLRDMWIEYVNEHKQVVDEELDDGTNGI